MPKSITASMRTHLAQTSTTLAMCWRLERRDGQIFTFTNHDRDLRVEDQDPSGTPIGIVRTYSAETAFDRSAVEQRGDMDVGNLEATGNYSYECHELCGPRWIMTGDASAFVDTVFSSGVFLAMHGAERAADVVDGVLRGARERPLQPAYAREMRAGLREFSWFIVRFTTPALAWLFANPRNVLRVEEAMISMLSGHVFGARQTLRRLRVFKFLYYVTSLVMWRDTLKFHRLRRLGVG